MKLFQRSSLFLMAFTLSTSLYAVSISINDQLDQSPDYDIERIDSRIISIDFAEKGIKLNELESKMDQHITNFKDSGFSDLNIAFSNISTKQQLKHIEFILDELKDDYDERIDIWELDYKDTASSSLQAKGNLMYENFIKACEKIKKYEEEREYRNYEHVARAEKRKEEFEESQGFGSSGWMGDEYFESSDEEEYY